MSEVVLILGGANRYTGLLPLDSIGDPTVVKLGASNTIPGTMDKLLREALAQHGSDIVAYLLPPRIEDRFTEDAFKRDAWHRATCEILPWRIRELEVFECHKPREAGSRFYVGGLDR